MNKSDLILFISFLLIISSLLVITYYVYTENVNECTSDPLKFAVEKIRYNYDSKYVYGTITIVQENEFYSWDFGDEFNLIK